MDALDRTLRDHISLAAEEIAARPLRDARGIDAAPRRTLRPLLAAAALAGVIAGAGTAVGLHHRLDARHVVPAASPPAVPTPITPASATPAPKPAPFDVGAATWDSTHAELVAFLPGGADKLGSAPSAVWTWNGAWHLRGEAGMPAGQRGLLADMPPLQGVVLLGDEGEPSWRWDGAEWRQIGTPPFPAYYGPDSAAYDAQRHQLVVLVGTRLSGDMTPPAPQTWTWDGRTWTRRVDAPLTAATAPLAWNPEAKSVVMAGDPFYSVTSVGHAQAWTWTGTTWRRYGSTGTFDLPPLVHGMAWDAAAHAMVLYAEPWYDNPNPTTILLAAGQWRMVTPATYPGRVATLVDDSTRNRVLLVGTAPLAASQTPAVSAAQDPETVLVWDGHGWADASGSP